jgi:hypothetical protein
MHERDPEQHPLRWFEKAADHSLTSEVVVSLYTRSERQDELFEMGVAIASGPLIRFQPLTYTPDALRPGAMYDVYAFVADEYVELLQQKGYRVRRLHAPFELAIREESRCDAGYLRMTRFNV